MYEAEDNSFYSEAIFNAGYLFQMLQVCSQLNFIAMIQINSRSYEDKCGWNHSHFYPQIRNEG